MTDLSVWSEEETRPRRRRRRKNNRGKGALAVVLALLLVGGLVGGLALLARGGIDKLKSGLSSSSAPDYPGPGGGDVLIEVKSGQTAKDVAATLKAQDVVKSTTAFLKVAYANPDSSKLQPGFYRVQKKMSAAEALSAVLDPSNQVQARVTVPEGKRLTDVITLLAKKTDIPLADFKVAVKKPKALGLPAYANNRVEGFLFPATYDIQPNATATDVLTMMVTRFKQAATELNLEKSDLTPYELVTVASLLEVEAKRNADYGKVSQVVRNRDAAGMPLQFDSTINYALSISTLKITTDNLKVESPYNTYTHVGLPPGPIDNPGLATLKAAANPTPGDWIYFFTTDAVTGETKFTADYNQFLTWKNAGTANSGP